MSSGIFRNLFTGEPNPLENPERRVTGGELVALLDKYAITVGGGTTKAGMAVTPEKGLRVIAVYRAVSLIGGLLGSLPLKNFDGEKNEVDVAVLEKPNDASTHFEYFETLGAHLGLWGNHYATKVRSALTGAVQEIWPYDPSTVEVQVMRPTTANPSGKVFEIEGLPGSRTPNEVWHVPFFSLDGYRGLSPIGLAREAIAASLSAERMANKLWDNGGLVQGILSTEAKISDEKAESIKQRWKKKIAGQDSAFDIAVLDAGMKFQQLSLPPQDLQFLESRGYQVTEIARLYGLPPHLLSQQERQTSWGTGIEQHNIGFVVYTMEPTWFRRIEQRASELTPVGTKTEYVIQGLMRGDSVARSQFYREMYRVKSLNPNEIRERENLAPYPGGEEFFAGDPGQPLPEEGM